MKKTKFCIVLFLIIFLIFSAGCFLLGRWERYKSPEGAFFIEMPTGKPTSQKIIIDTDFGQTYLYSFMLSSKDGFTYSVAFMDYPAEILQKKTINELLSSGRDGAIANVQGQLISELPITYKEYPGREITIGFAAGQGIIKARVYIVNQRLYQIMLATTKDKSEWRNIKRFLNSFELIETK